MQYIAGISISVFIVALLLNKRNKAQSDKYLLGWMFINALHLLLQYAYVTGYMLTFPFLYGIIAPIPLLHGIFLYLYVASVTNQFPPKKYVWIHFVPVILFYLYLFRYYFFLPVKEQVSVLETKGAGHELFMGALFTAVIISGIVYVILSSLLLRKHKKNILDRFSELAQIDLKWLQFLVYGLGALWGIIIFTQKDEYIFTGVVIFVILTGYFGIQQIDVYRKREQVSLLQENNQLINKKTEKYARSGLSESASTELYKELLELIDVKAVYKQQELSIGDLETLLNTHPNYLSQVINEKAGKRFYDFINDYRVEEFKKLIADPKNRQYTILSLAYDCGFNSKSSFNRYFKKATGSTPSQYLNSIS